MIRDTTARWMAAIALAVAVAGVGGYAHADSITEPDAYAVSLRVAQLETQVEALTSQIENQNEDIATLYANDGILDDRTNQAGCVAYSDFHYVRERVNNSKRKWRLPLAVWNMSDPGCRPNPKKAWRPNHRRALTQEVTRVR